MQCLKCGRSQWYCVCSHKDRQAPFELHVVLLSQNTDRPKCTCIAVQDIIVVLHTHPPTGTHAHSHTELKLKAQRGGYGGKKDASGVQTNISLVFPYEIRRNTI